MEKNNEIKSCFFEKIIKIDKTLVRFKTKREQTKSDIKQMIQWIPQKCKGSEDTDYTSKIGQAQRNGILCIHLTRLAFP